MSIPSETVGRPAPNIGWLRAALSEERFARYLPVAHRDEAAAWLLYEWGRDVAAAFYVPLHALAITLRNRIVDRVARVHGRFWLNEGFHGTWVPAL